MKPNIIEKLLVLIILICIVLYEIQGMFFDENYVNNFINSITSGGLLFALLLFLLLNFKFYKGNSRVQKTIVWLIISIYISSLITGEFVNAFLSLSEYIMVIMPLFLFLYSYVLCAKTSQQYALNYFLILFLVLLYYYFSNFTNISLANVTTQNNAVYALLYLLPFVLCIPRRSFRLLGIVALFVAIMFSLKRGGLIAFTGAISVYYIVNMTRQRGVVNRMLYLFLLIVIVFIAFYLFQYADSLGDGRMSERFSTIEDDEGSGRLSIWVKVIGMISELSFVDLLVGKGWDAVRLSLGLSSHNDFIEVLYNFGIIIFLMYVMFYVQLIKYAKILIKRKSYYAAPFCAAIVLMLINSFVSHIIVYIKYMMEFTLFFGYVIAAADKEIINKTISYENRNASLWYSSRSN